MRTRLRRVMGKNGDLLGSGSSECASLAIHTSSSSATGVASATSEYGSGYRAWNALDGDLEAGNNGGWFTEKDVVQAGWIYEFSVQRTVKKIRFYPAPNDDRQPKDFTLDTSNDGSNWNTHDMFLDVSVLPGGAWGEWVEITAPVKDKYFRVNVLGNHGDPQYTHIQQIQMCLEPL